jgi:hypothetical protein
MSDCYPNEERCINVEHYHTGNFIRTREELKAIIRTREELKARDPGDPFTELEHSRELYEYRRELRNAKEVAEETIKRLEVEIVELKRKLAAHE